MNKREYKTRGFIIARRKQGETSKVLTVVTKDCGRRTVIVKSARGTRSRTSGLAEPFMLVDLIAIEGRNFDTLKDISLVRSYKILEKSLTGFGAGNVVVEMLDKISRWQEDFDAYSLVIDYLQCYERNKLELARYDKVMIYLSSFIMSVLAVSGRLPLVDSCFICGKALNSTDMLLVAGGVCHRNCFGQSEAYVELDKTCFWWLSRIVTESCDVVLKYDCDDNTAITLFNSCMFLYRLFFEKEVKSSFFLKNIFNSKE